MKTSWIKGALVVLLIFVVGFKTDDIIELKQYLNGRGGPDFLASTKNVKYVVPKGTRAQIKGVKKFYSGNSGLNIEILSGPKKGETVWVYFNKNNPGMKLYEGDEALPEDKPARDLASAKSVETTRDHEGIKAEGVEGDKEISKANFDALDEKAKPKKLSKAEFDTLNKKIEKGQKSLKKIDTNCDNCSLQGVYSAGDVQNMDEPFLQEPLNQENSKGLQNPYDAFLTDPRCGPKVITVEECREIVKNHPDVLNYYQFTYKGDKDVSAYMISNRKKDPKTGVISKTGRDWMFKFEGQALQDSHILITDNQERDSVYFMFPRVTTPHVREVDGRLIATLPTGETATYDADTKKLIKGVLKETDAKGTSNVAYTGAGLVIRLDGEKPAGGEFEDPRRSKNAIITKDGRVCKVPSKDLFPDQKKDSALHFKFKKDAPLKQYLLKACGKAFNF